MRADAVRNREALVSAARSAFLEQGCDAPLDDVAKRACVGAGTLYRHFPTRKDLLAAVYVDDIETLCDDIERLGETMDPEAALVAYLDLQVDYGLRKIGLQRAIREVLADDSKVATFSLCKSKMMTAVGVLVDRAREAGVIRSDVDSQTLVKLLHGISTACDQTPDMAPAMIAVVRDGLLQPKA
ncbi:MAG TPA: TetR/AcrR family transcriptional regulator [Actinocrinis sp.]|jgi:AcrR family transcriptional regulator